MNGCATCSVSGAATCDACFPGKYLSGNTCTNCHSSCLTCTGSADTACASCRIGFYLNGNTCTVCSAADCNVCPGNTCNTCKTGYVYDPDLIIGAVTGNCARCAAGCANCKVNKIF